MPLVDNVARKGGGGLWRHFVFVITDHTFKHGFADVNRTAQATEWVELELWALGNSTFALCFNH